MVDAELVHRSPEKELLGDRLGCEQEEEQLGFSRQRAHLAREALGDEVRQRDLERKRSGSCQLSRCQLVGEHEDG